MQKVKLNKTAEAISHRHTKRGAQSHRRAHKEQPSSFVPVFHHYAESGDPQDRGNALQGNPRARRTDATLEQADESYHYNELLADCQIRQMSFEDNKGVQHKAPYYTKDEALSIYEVVRNEVRPYNQWDFSVVLNMVYADNYSLLKKWFPDYSEAQLLDKIVDLAVNWLEWAHCQHQQNTEISLLLRG